MGYIGAGITRFNTADELTVTGDAQIDTTTLVVDSTNNRVGVGNASPATALDVTGTVTADGLIVDGNIHRSVDNQNIVIAGGTSDSGATIRLFGSTHPSLPSDMFFDADDHTFRSEDAATTKIKIANNGDISFYADNGTTQGLFWDASTQRLGLGTTTPDKDLTVSGEVKITGGLPRLFFDNTSDGIGEVEAVGLTATDLRFGFSQDNVVFRSGSAERMRIDSSGKVGIGTTSPTHNLDVFNSASSGAPLLAQFKSAGGDTQLYVDNSTITTQLTADASNTAGIVGTKTNHPFVFRTNNAERMRIDSSGNLLVGKTSAASNVVGAFILNSGLIRADVDGGVVGVFNRKTSDGDALVIQKDGSTVGSINTEGGRIAIGTSDTGLYFNDGGDALVGWNISANTSRDNAIDLGTSGVKFKDLYLSGSVNFSGNEISGTSITIADDAVGTVTPPRNGGFFTIVYNGIGSFPFSTHSSFVYYDVGGSLAISKATDHGSNLSVTTSNVTGTTGTDGHTTVSAQSGVLKIENRSGNSSSYQITFM